MKKLIDWTVQRQKLEDVGRHCLRYRDDEFMKGICRLIAKRMVNPRTTPEGMCIVVVQVFLDLRSGVSGFEDEPLPASLVGHPSEVYAAAEDGVRKILEAIFEPEDAVEISATFQRMGRVGPQGSVTAEDDAWIDRMDELEAVAGGFPVIGGATGPYEPMSAAEVTRLRNQTDEEVARRWITLSPVPFEKLVGAVKRGREKAAGKDLTAEAIAINEEVDAIGGGRRKGDA